MINNKIKKRTEVKRLYTTGEVARYCEVDINTVKRWIRQGEINAFSTPSGHYRIERDQFMSFIKEYGFPYDAESLGEVEHVTDILIIEDDPDQINLLSYLLENLYGNLHIETATDGFNGYLKICERIPRLVILDLMLPGMTGLELLRVIRSRSEIQEVKILVISGYLDAPAMNELKKLNVDAMLSKPVKKARLKEKCDLLLGEVIRKRNRESV